MLGVLSSTQPTAIFDLAVFITARRSGCSYSDTMTDEQIETSDESIEHVLAISGRKSLKANIREKVNIGGINYTILKKNNGCAVNSSSLNLNSTPNDQHAEQKIMDYLSRCDSENLNITMSVQNVSSEDPGMCKTCRVTVPEFAARHPNFNFIDIFQGTTRTRP